MSRDVPCGHCMQCIVTDCISDCVLCTYRTHLHTQHLQVHGDEDQVVGFRWGEHSHQLTQTFGLTHPPQFIAIEVCLVY